MNFKKYIFTISLVIILFIVSFILYTINIRYNINISTEIILAVDAIIITIFIALTQEDQIKKLKDIGNQTKETTEKLETDSSIRKIVDKFFDIKDKNKKYKLFFPVEFKEKPLPLINQGDFYAINVVSTRLGEDNLVLEPVIAKNYISEGNSLKTDAIFICAPHSNPASRKPLSGQFNV